MFNLYKNSYEYAKTLTKWVFFASLAGIVGGIVGSVFHESIDAATTLRTEKPWIIFFLPLGGVAIYGMYAIFKKSGKIDTNRVIESISEEGNVPFVMAPLIFISATLTHLLGGSAGREGAALQLGGSIGYRIGKLFKLGKNDMHIIVMTGMSAVFAALFGTPVTAAIFAIEVISVGVFHYAALLSCVISAFCGYYISMQFVISPVRFNLLPLDGFSFEIILKSGVIAAVSALVSILFCVIIRKTGSVSKKILNSGYLRGFLGGSLILILTVLVGNYDYNGTGMNVIADAIGGNARPEAFILKIIFTAITIAAGFKGGEIVPAFFVGATLGCTLGGLLGIDPGFGAAIGFIALFCGVTNCPMASLFLSIEVFGTEQILLFAMACAISYVLSGYSGLYRSQKIIYSKTNDEYIDLNTK